MSENFWDGFNTNDEKETTDQSVHNEPVEETAPQIDTNEASPLSESADAVSQFADADTEPRYDAAQYADADTAPQLDASEASEQYDAADADIDSDTDKGASCSDMP